MTSQRQIRRDKREENAYPLNYTCGKCKLVHEFDEEKPYICPLRPKEEGVTIPPKTESTEEGAM